MPPRGAPASTGDLSSPALAQRLASAGELIKSWTGSSLGQRVGRWFNALLSILILLLLVRAIAQVGWQQVIDVVPASPLFWLLMLAGYLLPPLVEWFIYRRWWRFDFRAIGAFLKMRVMNDALFSYSGHTYLLVWASRFLGVGFDPEDPPPVNWQPVPSARCPGVQKISGCAENIRACRCQRNIVLDAMHQIRVGDEAASEGDHLEGAGMERRLRLVACEAAGSDETASGGAGGIAIGHEGLGGAIGFCALAGGRRHGDGIAGVHGPDGCGGKEIGDIGDAFCSDQAGAGHVRCRSTIEPRLSRQGFPGAPQ